MTTWIAWPPDNPETKFPKNFLEGDPLNQYGEAQKESCPECGFTVQWVSDKYQFEHYNDDNRKRIRASLERQRELNNCPKHPLPGGI